MMGADIVKKVTDNWLKYVPVIMAEKKDLCSDPQTHQDHITALRYLDKSFRCGSSVKAPAAFNIYEVCFWNYCLNFNLNACSIVMHGQWDKHLKKIPFFIYSLSLPLMRLSKEMCFQSPDLCSLKTRVEMVYHKLLLLLKKRSCLKLQMSTSVKQFLL